MGVSLSTGMLLAEVYSKCTDAEYPGGALYCSSWTIMMGALSFLRIKYSEMRHGVTGGFAPEDEIVDHIILQPQEIDQPQLQRTVDGFRAFPDVV